MPRRDDFQRVFDHLKWVEDLATLTSYSADRRTFTKLTRQFAPALVRLALESLDNLSDERLRQLREEMKL